LVTSLCDFNVGLFAALAGFLMNGVKDWSGYVKYIKKRVVRLVPTYLFWSVVFLAFTAAFDLLLDGGRIHPRYFCGEFWVSVLFRGGSAAHLWFLVCLLYAQILMALPFGKFKSEWHGVHWIVIGGAALYGAVRIGGWYGTYPLRLFAFLMTGYGIRLLVILNIDKIKRFSGLILAVAVTALGVHVAMRGVVAGFYKDWVAVFPVLVGVASVEVKSIRVGKIAAVLGATSMGVYLLHPLVTRGLSVVITRQIAAPYSASVVVGEWVVAWGISMVAAVLMLRLPVIRRFV
jgi:peptidoglycan/LPS O-acetylase OafA/YrhL